MIIFRYLFLGGLVIAGVFIWSYYQSKRPVEVNIPEGLNEPKLCTPYEDDYIFCACFEDKIKCAYKNYNGKG